ncbi:MAG: Rossmann-like and DUF2520 domain-containing protein [Bacillota bacterium]
MKIGIIGAGSVGTGVGFLLREKGHVIIGVASRTHASRERAAKFLGAPGMHAVQVARAAEVVLITTNDGAIGDVARDLAKSGAFSSGQTVIHMSGSLTSRILEPAAQSGAKVLSVHPLQSCANVERAIANLPGSIFSIEGDREAYPVAEQLVKDLGGDFFYISKEAKPLYHAAACVASNYLVSLLDLSRQLMLAAGMPPELAVNALMPLIEGTLDNVQNIGIPKALTGPISRGDESTVVNHLEAMAQQAPHLYALYAALGRQTADVAGRKGSISNEQVRRFQSLLGGAVEPTRKAASGGAGNWK